MAPSQDQNATARQPCATATTTATTTTTAGVSKKAKATKMKKGAKKDKAAPVGTNEPKKEAASGSTNEPKKEAASGSTNEPKKKDEAAPGSTNEPKKDEASPGSTNEPKKDEAAPGSTSEPKKKDEAASASTNEPKKKDKAASASTSEPKKKDEAAPAPSPDPKKEPKTTVTKAAAPEAILKVAKNEPSDAQADVQQDPQALRSKTLVSGYATLPAYKRLYQCGLLETVQNVVWPLPLTLLTGIGNVRYVLNRITGHTLVYDDNGGGHASDRVCIRFILGHGSFFLVNGQVVEQQEVKIKVEEIAAALEASWDMNDAIVIQIPVSFDVMEQELIILPKCMVDTCETYWALFQEFITQFENQEYSLLCVADLPRFSVVLQRIVRNAQLAKRTIAVYPNGEPEYVTDTQRIEMAEGNKLARIIVTRDENQPAEQQDANENKGEPYRAILDAMLSMQSPALVRDYVVPVLALLEEDLQKTKECVIQQGSPFLSTGDIATKKQLKDIFGDHIVPKESLQDAIRTALLSWTGNDLQDNNYPALRSKLAEEVRRLVESTLDPIAKVAPQVSLAQQQEQTSGASWDAFEKREQHLDALMDALSKVIDSLRKVKDMFPDMVQSINKTLFKKDASKKKDSTTPDFRLKRFKAMMDDVQNLIINRLSLWADRFLAAAVHIQQKTTAAIDQQAVDTPMAEQVQATHYSLNIAEGSKLYDILHIIAQRTFMEGVRDLEELRVMPINVDDVREGLRNNQIEKLRNIKDCILKCTEAIDEQDNFCEC